ADAELARNAGITAGKVPPAFGIKPSSEIAYLKGDTWAFGWNIGAMWEINEANRLALTYRSKVKLDFDGTYRSQLPAIAGGTGGKDVDANLKVDLPDIWEISGYSRLSPQFALSYGVMRTGWNAFEELKATSNSCAKGVCLQKDESFETAYRYSVGGTYYHSPEWTFRAGFAYDEKASNKHQSISIPDQDRIWYTLGTTYAFNSNMSVDAGFAYLNGRGANFDEYQGPIKSTFEAKGDAYLYSIGMNYSF
ncbi:MAG: porin, partial [Plesiomonas sp.]